MEIQVRPATIDDAADACGLIRSSILECCHDDHRGDATVLQWWLRNKTPDFVRGVVSSPNAYSVVASVGDEAVGFASASATGEVTLCYALPSMRFTGVGKALLAAIEDHAARAGSRHCAWRARVQLGRSTFATGSWLMGLRFWLSAWRRCPCESSSGQLADTRTPSRLA